MTLKCWINDVENVAFEILYKRKLSYLNLTYILKNVTVSNKYSLGEHNSLLSKYFFFYKYQTFQLY